jgi:hypothetical protein
MKKSVKKFDTVLPKRNFVEMILVSNGMSASKKAKWQESSFRCNSTEESPHEESTIKSSNKRKKM